jgi:hypothetical protein
MGSRAKRERLVTQSPSHHLLDHSTSYLLLGTMDSRGRYQGKSRGTAWSPPRASSDAWPLNANAYQRRLLMTIRCWMQIYGSFHFTLRDWRGRRAGCLGICIPWFPTGLYYPARKQCHWPRQRNRSPLPLCLPLENSRKVWVNPQGDKCSVVSEDYLFQYRGWY